MIQFLQLQTMKSLLFLISITCSLNLSAQSDTTYLDKYGEKSSQNTALYYRITSKEGDLYIVHDYYMTEVLQMSGSYSSLDPEIREGYFKYFNKNGVLTHEGNYIADEKTGVWKSYYASEKLYAENHYQKGEYDGSLIIYYENGNLKRKDIFTDGKFISGECYSETGKKLKHFPYEEPSSFKGGIPAMKKFLAKNMYYPDAALDNNIQGKVWVRFVVNEKGQVSDAVVTKSVHPLLDQEALRVVRKMPKWIPGKIDGEKVKSYYDLPVNFKLD